MLDNHDDGAKAPSAAPKSTPDIHLQRTATSSEIRDRSDATKKRLRGAQITKAGSLAFPNTDQTRAKFAIIPKRLEQVNEQVNDAVDALVEVWKLDLPNVLISVTGGAMGLEVEKRLLTSFQRGLRAAVRTTKAWVITGGTKSGCMELVGKKTLEKRAAASRTANAPLTRLACRRVAARRTWCCWALRPSTRYMGATISTLRSSG